MFKKKELTRLGDILVSKGLITPAQLDLAIAEQSRRKRLLDPSDSTATVAPIGEILIELGFIDRLQLKRGLNWQLRLRHASIAMALCAPFMMFAPSIARAAPITVEAENYSTMSGVRTENTIDIGGGKNVGYIDSGDWMTYDNINIPESGNYKVTLRVASPNGGGAIQLKSSTGTLLDTIDVPATSGWQTWVDVEKIIPLTAGNNNLTLMAQTGGFNLNWIKVEHVKPISLLIEAESYSSMSGIKTESTKDTGGGLNVGYIDPGDTMNFENAELIIPLTGTYKISYRVANTTEGSVMELKNIVTGAVLDTVSIPKTGGWQTWATVERLVTLEQGLTKLQIFAKKGSFNFNWFKVESVENQTVVTPTPIASPETIFPLTIRAENYSEMTGVRKEPTTDAGGGASVGYIDTGDSMSYANTIVRAPYTGKYKIFYRVASLNGGATFALNEYGTNITLNSIDIPKTGGWQTWATLESEITLTEGEHKFSILAKTGGANINWIKIEPIATVIPLTIQAEDYSTMSGIKTEAAIDTGGGLNVGYVDTGDWMAYSNVEVFIPNTANYKMTYRVATTASNAVIELYSLDGNNAFDTVPVPSTGGWQKWADVERTITLPAGKHTFGIRAPKGGFNLNWFKLEKIDTTAASSSVVANQISSSSSSSSSSVTSVPGGTTTTSSSSTPSMTASTSSRSSSSASAHVAGPVGLRWTAPNKRENGTYLDVTELGGYEIRYKKTTDTKFTYISINDAWTTTYNFPWLEGDYIFQIAAFDKNGVYSPFVDIQRQ